MRQVARASLDLRSHALGVDAAIVNRAFAAGEGW